MSPATDDLGAIRHRAGKGLGQLHQLPRAWALIRAAAGSWTWAWTALIVAQALLPVAIVYATRELVNRLVAVLDGPATFVDARPALVMVGVMAALMLASEALRALGGWVRATQAELVEAHIQDLVHERSAAADLGLFDSPDYHDHLHRARLEASYRPVALLENLGGLLQGGLTLVAMLAVLAGFGLWLPAALLLSTLPALYVALRGNIRQHALRRSQTAAERRGHYYDWLLTEPEPAAELRLFDLGPRIRSAYRTLRDTLRRRRLDLERRQGVALLAAGAFGLAVTGAATAWIVWRAIQGAYTLGDLALFYQAFSQGQRLLRSLLEQAGGMYGNVLFLGDLFEFLELEPTVTDPEDPLPMPRPLRNAIRIENVTFAYPGSETAALDRFDLDIPAGGVTALVGPNGAGKSTLLKLLCRLYDPQEGRVLLDDTDLRQLALSDLRGATSAMFQRPLRHSDTAAENIRLARSAAGDGEIRVAGRAADFDEVARRLPDGYDTLLGKWFVGGTDLSGGEWQRLALARAFLRDAEILLLDEPTSAMDSWAEAEWMDRFRELAVGRTTLLITHRFTTARRADTIHVIDEGRVVESGSHEELLARGGRYAESWQRQQQESP